MPYEQPPETTYQSGLQRALGRYSTMMRELRALKAAAETPTPAEYEQLVNLYRAGGEYGAGARARILEEQKAGTAADVAGLIRSGMSSQAITSGVAARRSRYAQQALQQVEDVRYERLSAALQALAAAREARAMRMSQAYQTAAQLVGSFAEPSASQYVDPYRLAILQGELAAIPAVLRRKTESEELSLRRQMLGS